MNMLPPDKLIHDRYRIVRPIKPGGFGAVYEVQDERLNRRAALKQLLLTSDEVRRKFTDEAHMLANLDNPHLPDVTDQFTDPDGQFLVMDYIPGDDLAMQLLKRGKPFPVEQVVKWGLQLLDVLEYLHTRNPPIVHRDIKPENLKLRSDDFIILLDFGLAKGYVGETGVTTPDVSLPAYTRRYAAPEHMEHRGTDARTDVYALGATLYNLLTNYPLIESNIRAVKTARQEPDPLLPPHHFNPEVPEALSRVLMAAMALEPGDRPSVQEMRQSLRAIRPGFQPSGGHEQIVMDGVQVGAGLEPTELDLAPTEMDRSTRQLGEELANLYAQARRHYNAQDWTLVVSIFARIVAIDPEYPDREGLLAGAQAALKRAGERHLGLRIWKYLVLSVAGLLVAALLVFIAWRMAEPLYSLVATLTGHRGNVRDVDFSSDGKTLASASFDGTVKLWQLGDSPDPQILQESTSFALGVAFSPDGQILASASADGTVKLWRTSDGVELRTLSRHMDWINQVAFSPEGQMLASASSDSTIKLWRVSDGTVLRTLPEAAGVVNSRPVYDVAFTPDGNTLASASFTTVKLWRVSDGAELRTLLMNSEDLVFGVAFSPDGQILASASADGTVKLWRTGDGVELRTLSGHEVGVNQVAFSPDGQMLASASSDSTIKLWRVSDGIELTTLVRPISTATQSPVYDVAFSPDGQILAAASADGTVTLWRVKVRGS